MWRENEDFFVKKEKLVFSDLFVTFERMKTTKTLHILSLLWSLKIATKGRDMN